jgi:hypothetical protein
MGGVIYCWNPISASALEADEVLQGASLLSLLPLSIRKRWAASSRRGASRACGVSWRNSWIGFPNRLQHLAIYRFFGMGRGTLVRGLGNVGTGVWER